MIVTIILFGGLVLFLLLGFPIAIAIFLATLAGFLYCDVSLAQMVQRMFASVNSFTILAIPFFMLAGSLMESRRHDPNAWCALPSHWCAGCPVDWRMCRCCPLRFLRRCPVLPRLPLRLWAVS